MAQALKDSLLGPEVAPRLARMVQRAWRRFDATAFVAAVEPGYARLELMQRGQRMADALAAQLPHDVARALQILVEAMDEPLALDARGEPDAAGRPYSGFLYLPHSLYIAQHALGHFDAAMQAQHALTQRFTAEWCLRPFLEHHREATLSRLQQWAYDPSAHVRRLVSEGTRPRLPWAPRLRAFAAHPEPVIALLDSLKDDPSSYVRRSVANHLGDLAKDAPTVALSVARRWMVGANTPRRNLIRHGLRHPLRQGDVAALALFGHDRPARFTLTQVAVSPARVPLGGHVQVAASLASRARVPQDLRIDLRVHYRKADGSARPKTFKLPDVCLQPGQVCALRKRLDLRPMSTRTHYPGRHAVELVVNGQAHALGAFELFQP